MSDKIKFDKSAEFIYGLISSRLKARKKYYLYKNYQILKDDPQLVSNILNNKRTARKNPYLITTTYFNDISKNLHFISVDEMLWGKEEEFKAYGGHLFSLLIDEIIKSNSDIKSTVIDLLNDYAPFARINCYDEFFEKHHDDWIKIYYDSEFKTSIEDKHNIQLNAIGRLYERIQENFTRSFLEFFKDKDTFKFNSKLNEFSEYILLPILISEYETIANTSIGFLVYMTLFAQLNRTPSEVEFHLDEDNYHSYCTPETEEAVVKVYNELRNATPAYVENLIQIQQRLGWSHYEEHIEDKWTEKMGLPSEPH